LSGSSAAAAQGAGIDLDAGGPIARQKIEESWVALQELGLDDGVDACKAAALQESRTTDAERHRDARSDQVLKLRT
jgi:hypothetical protein